MDSDLLLTVGIILLALTIPALLNAFTEGRFPKGAALVVLVSSGMILTALIRHPGGYTFDQIPGVMMGVFRNALN